MKTENQLSIFEPTTGTQMYEYKMSVDRLQAELSKYGLTANQSKVFIYLGKYGAKTAPEVCKSLKIPRTETYHLLSSLQSKGIVSATFQHPIQFSALSLDKAISTLVNSEKERVRSLESLEGEISQLWDNIPDFQTHAVEEENKFQILQGANQIQSKIVEMTDSFKDEFIMMGSEKDFLRFYHSDFLEPFVKAKKNFRLLSSCSEKTLYIFDDIDRKRVRNMINNVNNDICFVLKDDSELIFFTKNATLSQEPYAMWTNTPSLIHSMQMLFEFSWNSAQSIHL